MKKTLLSLSLLLTLAAPAAAQDAACEIDLASTVGLLVQAQASASGGDSDMALTLIGLAQTKLDAFEAACGEVVVDVPSTPEIALTQSYTLEDSVGDLIVSYPGDWVATEDGGGLVVGTSLEVASRDFDSEPPPFATGEVALFVAVGDTNDFGGSGASEPVALLSAITSNVPPEFGRVTEVTGFTINDQPAAQFSVFGSETELLVATVRLGSDGGEPLFGQLILLTAPGEQALYEPLLLEIAAALELVVAP